MANEETLSNWQHPNVEHIVRCSLKTYFICFLKLSPLSRQSIIKHQQYLFIAKQTYYITSFILTSNVFAHVSVYASSELQEADGPDLLYASLSFAH